MCVRLFAVDGGWCYLVSWSWLSGLVLLRSSGCWLGSVLEVVVVVVGVVVEVVVGVERVEGTLFFFIKSGTIFFWM